jgi:hypothetical protein
MSIYDDFSKILKEAKLTLYHEAGHAVALYAYRFRPTRIDQNRTEHDCRTTWFIRAGEIRLNSCHARERASEYAVCCIGGIVAESRMSRIPLTELRKTSGRDDYEMVRSIARSLLERQRFEYCPPVVEGQIGLLERRAMALIHQTAYWRAVESVVADLEQCGGSLNGKQIASAIERVIGRQSTMSKHSDSGHIARAAA